jgi:alkyl hydroperoxide reductase subunit F
MHDLIIVGAGPAGLAAALYALRKRLDFLLISPDIGGKSTWTVAIEDADSAETIRAAELVTVYRTRVESLRHSIERTKVTGVARTGEGFSVKTDAGTHEAKAVIVASGTSLRTLDVPGESEFRARGLGYSAISYSHLFAGRRVFLAGDSDRAVNAAIEMSLHADEVTLALLREGRFSPPQVKRVEALERVTVVRDAMITSFTGDGYARTAKLNGENGTLEVAADGFFVELEPEPNSGFLENLKVRNPSGYVEVDGHNETGIPGLFAAGDVTGNGFEQILVSLGDGAKAVLSAYRYLLTVGITGR